MLIIFTAAAVLTSSPHWWNQTIVATPMIAMYLLSIVVAWLGEGCSFNHYGGYYTGLSVAALRDTTSLAEED